MSLEGNTYIIRERKKTRLLRAGVSFGDYYPTPPLPFLVLEFYPIDRLKLTDAFFPLRP